MDKYEYLTGEDLGYKPDVIQKAKFEFFPLGEAFNKVFKKGDKVNKVTKYNNRLAYDSVHNFNKYSVSNFNEISSIETKFDTTGKLYQDLFAVKDHLLSKFKIRIQSKKNNCVKNASLPYYEFINMYRKEYKQVFESKDENWREKHDYKSLKDFSYQVNKVNNVNKVNKVDKADKEEKEEKDEDKADETGQDFPPWIESKDEFDKLKNRILSIKENN